MKRGRKEGQGRWGVGDRRGERGNKEYMRGGDGLINIVLLCLG